MSHGRDLKDGCLSETVPAVRNASEGMFTVKQLVFTI